MPKVAAVNFLREQLASGPVATNELQARAKAAGFSWAMMRRLKTALRIETAHRAGKWFWNLPKRNDAQAAQPAVAVLAARAAQLQTAHSAQPSPRRRVVVVKRPGVVPQGPDELSHAEWEALGHEVERVREYLARRAMRGAI